MTTPRLRRRPPQPSGAVLPGSGRVLVRVLIAAAAATAGAAGAFPNYPITPEQRSTAEQVAQAGVPLAELAPNAPQRYTVKRGDTLWAISALYLKRPWRWPELWGMNLQQIRNPHLIYPGQVLVLTRVGDRAFLQLADEELPTVKLSPRVRSEPLAQTAIPPLPPGAIEPFLVDVTIVDAQRHEQAPRIVAGPENRVLLARGDRAYARSQYGPAAALSGDALEADARQQQRLTIYRHAQPLRDPDTGELLGYETYAVGRATLVRGESVVEERDGTAALVPATIDIVQTREEVRIGDRLLQPTTEESRTYVPHAPGTVLTGRIVKVHGDAVQMAGQNQIVVLNRGAADGLQPGHVLALFKGRTRVVDRTDERQPDLLLPAERNGVMMVFRTFERVSYALVLHITDAVRVGDHFGNP